jgi:ribosome-binding factor A
MTKFKAANQQGPTQRQRRVGEEVRSLLSSIFLRGDHHIADFDSSRITVTEVRMSVDLRHAFAFVMTLGGEHLEETLVTLKQIAPLLRSLISKSLRLRTAPMLHFEPDKSFDEVDRLEALLRSPQVAQDLQSK